jgi:signal transduction histidine kinase
VLYKKFYNNIVVVILVVAAAAAILSIISYQYSSSISNEILKVAIEDIRSNAKIQAHDLSRSLANSISSIVDNLQVIASSSAIQAGSLADQTLFDSAQLSTNRLTEGYYWLDRDGRVVTYSEINKFPNYIGVDLSFRDYFKIPRDKHTQYYSTVIDSTDKVQRIYISYPILGNPVNGSNNDNNTVVAASNRNNKNTINNNNEIFKGVVVAALRAINIGKFLQDELLKEFPNTVVLIDRNGIVLYPQNQTFIGKNYFGNEFQSIIPAVTKSHLNDIVKRSLEGKAGVEDIAIAEGNVSTVAYNPVVLDGNYLWTLYIVSPHKLAENVHSLINEGSAFSITILALIVAIALAIFLTIMSWNRSLKRAVNTRTQELNKAVNELAQANEQLKTHDRIQRDFINIAAHELRTPIQPILGLGEVLQSKIKDNEQRSLMDPILRNAKRLRRLTEEILDVTRIESHGLEIRKEKFNIKDIIADVVQDYRNHTRNSHNIELLYETAEDTFVEADKAKITQVISNLIDNAIKFTNNEKNNERGIISITLEKKGNQAIVSVKDTGRGIDHEILPRLFTKFASKSFSGTGLGLFISKGIIEAHGGRIWAQNNADGKGATFSFTLPLNIQMHVQNT